MPQKVMTIIGSNEWGDGVRLILCHSVRSNENKMSNIMLKLFVFNGEYGKLVMLDEAFNRRLVRWPGWIGY